jgi:hypothetical protein
MKLSELRIYVKKYGLADLYEYLENQSDAMAGDMIWVATPSTVSASPTAAIWTREVVITLEDADGDLHDWFSDEIATGISIGDTSSAGEATIVSTTLDIVEGKATIVVSGDAQAWLGGTAQVRTITATKGTGIRQVRTITCTAGESTGAGNITMTVTAAGMDNSAKDVVVAIAASDDTVTQVGDLVRAALALDADVSSYFTVSGTAGVVILTVIDPVADDGTLDNTFVDTDGTGVTFGASVDTTAGTAPAAGDITMTVTAVGMDNSAKDVVVAIGATDYDLEDVGANIRAAMNLDADVSAFFTVSGTGGIVILTAITPAVDDATLDNTFVDTDTTGVTMGASVDTTPGVAKETDTLTIAEKEIMGYTVSAVTSVETFED